MPKQQNSSNCLKAAVFGGSISGLMSTIVLAKKGFKVDLYEKREKYSRNIQWGVRQSFIDYLACMDQNLADQFYNNLASTITNGHRFFADKCSLYAHGAYSYQHRSSPQKGICGDENLSGSHTLDEEIVCLVPAKELEAFLYEFVAKNDAVTIHHETAPHIKLEESSNKYYIEDSDSNTPYDLIVVSEGASSTTRSDANILSMDLSRKVKQVSGEVYLKRHGMIIEYLHAKNNKARLREEFLLSMLISTERHQTCWVVGDVSYSCMKSLNVQNLSEDEKRDIIKQEFRTIASRTMINAEQNIIEAGYQGAVHEIKLFDFQAKISNTAIAGDNLILAGDSVGNGHWSVGGGMHVAAVCHSKRLEILATSILGKSNDRASALKEYNDGVLADTTAWISRGIKYYYLSIPGDVIQAVFDELIVELMNDNKINFPEQLKLRVTSVYFKD